MYNDEIIPPLHETIPSLNNYTVKHRTKFTVVVPCKNILYSSA